MITDISTGTPNCTLTYVVGGAQRRARLRCKLLAINYGVNSDESHARRNRAFYPRRRFIGGFSMTFDLLGWTEYQGAMNWFKGYADTVLSKQSPSAVCVVMKSRDFVHMAVPTTGISYGDHTGSMVFSPTVTFVSTGELLDVTKTGSLQGPSYFDDSTSNSYDQTWFYPGSKMNQPGELQRYLYDIGIAKQKQVASTVNPLPQHGPDRPE